MSEHVTPGGAVTLRASGFSPGLAGTLGVEVQVQATRATVIARTTVGITPDPVNPRVYRYTLNPAPTAPGEYLVYWTDAAVDPVETAEQELIVSNAGSPIALTGQNLTSLAEVKAMLEISHTDDDDLIEDLITAASVAIARRYQREFRPHATLTRRFRVTNRLVDLVPYDLRAATSVTLHPEGAAQGLSALQYMLEPIGGDPLTGTFNRLRLAGSLHMASPTVTEFGYAQLEITGQWGCWDAVSVPDDVRRACVMTVGSWMDRAVAEYALDSDGGRQILPERGTTWSIPHNAHRLLQPYERMVFA